MNQTKLLFPLIFISLEDDSSIVIPPQPTSPGEIMSGGDGEPIEADEPEEGENDTTPAETERTISGVLASTETVTHEYLTQSGKVVRETITTSMDTTTLDFFYDESGRPFAFNYTPEGSTPNTYYYILNLQGDVVQIIDEGGVMQAEYVYSPWGEIISAEGDLAEINPLRYRGYYYDSETGFYYLRSRYYDPENHRFINADTYASTDSSDAIACNMFAYCLGTPILLQDPDGKDSFGVSIGFSFWIFGWGFSVSAGIVGTDDDIGLQFSVARSDTFDTSSQMGVSIGPSVSVQVTDRTVTSGLDGPSTAVGGGKDLGFDALFDENNDYMGWQLNAGLDSGIIVPSADIHKITSKTYTVHVMPTINLPKRAKDWVYRDEKQ